MNLPPELQQGQNVVISETKLQSNSGSPYIGIVSHDGYFHMPLIPRLYVEGKVTDEVVQLIQQELSKLYDNPVAVCNVTNLKLYLFGFSGGV
jgi:protein involved in polysaccharide export with SLBB domain